MISLRIDDFLKEATIPLDLLKQSVISLRNLRFSQGIDDFLKESTISDEFIKESAISYDFLEASMIFLRNLCVP